MADVRDNPFEGFAHAAGPVLVRTPVVNLAAIAYVLCHKTATADWLRATLQQVPGVRGPRSAALTALYDEKFEFDDVNARQPRYPDVDVRPYARSGGSITSAGGVVDKVTMEKDRANVSLKKTTAKRLACVQSKPTNRLSRIRPDGSLEYQSICLKSAIVTYDTTWADFKINPAHAALLKSGVVFSSVYGDPFFDVVALWSNANATTPSMLLVMIALASCSLAGGVTTTSGPTMRASSTSLASSPTTDADGKIEMIDLTGMTADEASAALHAAGFQSSPEVNRIMLECEGVAKQVGRINCQSPQPGALAERRAIISVNVYDGPHQIGGALVRAQLEKVRGMTIAEARSYLKSLGHDGEVAIWEQPTFSNSCGVQKVCAASPEGGTGIHDRVTLVINPNSSVDISLPP